MQKSTSSPLCCVPTGWPATSSSAIYRGTAEIAHQLGHIRPRPAVSPILHRRARTWLSATVGLCAIAGAAWRDRNGGSARWRGDSMVWLRGRLVADGSLDTTGNTKTGHCRAGTRCMPVSIGQVAWALVYDEAQFHPASFQAATRLLDRQGIPGTVESLAVDLP